MMRLLMIRHGTSISRESFAATAQNDDKRPLTDKGIAEMERIAVGLGGLVKRVDLIAPSPLTRAKQTARIVAKAYGMTVGDAVDALRPESPLDAFVGWAARHSSNRVIGIVGHDPHLSRLVTWLMTGSDEERVVLKKGGACLLTFDGEPGRAAGTLEWLMTPKQILGAANIE